MRSKRRGLVYRQHTSSPSNIGAKLSLPSVNCVPRHWFHEEESALMYFYTHVVTIAHFSSSPRTFVLFCCRYQSSTATLNASSTVMRCGVVLLICQNTSPPSGACIGRLVFSWPRRKIFWDPSHPQRGPSSDKSRWNNWVTPWPILDRSEMRIVLESLHLALMVRWARGWSAIKKEQWEADMILPVKRAALLSEDH